MSRLPCCDVCALTHREIVVLRLVGRGWTYGQIAKRLGLQKSTILGIRNELHSKLHVRSHLQLALWAHRYGYVSLDEIDYGVTVERVRELLIDGY